MTYAPLILTLFACLMCAACDSGEDASRGSEAQAATAEDLWPFSLEGNPIQGFYCDAQGAPFGYLIFNDQGGIEVRPEGGLPFAATYRVSGEGWLIEASSIGFSETTTTLEPRLGMVGRFTTQTLSCHAVGWQIDQALAGRYQCPPIKYIEGISYEDNLFEFGPNGDVFRSNRTERLGANGDTLFNRTHGIYRVHEDRVYMYFGDSTIERDLSAQVMAGSWISVDQLNPEAGQCELTD